MNMPDAVNESKAIQKAMKNILMIENHNHTQIKLTFSIVLLFQLEFIHFLNKFE